MVTYGMPGTRASGKNLAAAIRAARRLRPVRNHARKVRYISQVCPARESESAALRVDADSEIEATAAPSLSQKTRASVARSIDDPS